MPHSQPFSNLMIKPSEWPLLMARNDNLRDCHCEEHSDEAIPARRNFVTEFSALTHKFGDVFRVRPPRRKPGSSAVKPGRIGALSTAPGHPGLDSDFRRNDGEFGLIPVFRPSRKTSGSNTSPYLRHEALRNWSTKRSSVRHLPIRAAARLLQARFGS